MQQSSQHPTEHYLRITDHHGTQVLPTPATELGEHTYLQYSGRTSAVMNSASATERLICPGAHRGSDATTLLRAAVTEHSSGLSTQISAPPLPKPTLVQIDPKQLCNTITVGVEVN